MEQLGNAGEHGSRQIQDSSYLISGYLPTIGIECHVQLDTATKLFSATDNDARDAEPNSKVNQIDYGLPGMLPVLNHGAIVKAVRAGKALKSTIANISRFDRKHYFYPDLPKGYQISQLYHPLIIGGEVKLSNGAIIRIHHAHVEEDAGKLTHHADGSLVDLNRAGTPLIEIVSEPDIHSAAEARDYTEELHRLMCFAGVTIGDLYHGNMRFDVNISVAKPGKELGVRTEIKNLNSFRAVERATDYEIRRQIDLLESGEQVQQQTRGWSDATGQTTLQRSKEDAQDYRYMPDPDIPPVVLTDSEISAMQADFPMMPDDYRAKFADLAVDESVIGVLLGDKRLAELISQIIDNSSLAAAKKIANMFASAMPEDGGDQVKLPNAEHLARLATLIDNNKLSSTGAKQVLGFMLENDQDPEDIAKKHNLIQVSDSGAINKVVEAVLSDPANQQAITDYKNGEEKVLGFLVGQVMKQSRGQANPQLARQTLLDKLK